MTKNSIKDKTVSNLRFVNEVIDNEIAKTVNGDVTYSVYSRFELEDKKQYETQDEYGDKVFHGLGFCDCLGQKYQMGYSMSRKKVV